MSDKYTKRFAEVFEVLENLKFTNCYDKEEEEPFDDLKELIEKVIDKAYEDGFQDGVDATNEEHMSWDNPSY